MATFEDAKITAFQPRFERDNETGEHFSSLVFRGETQVKNSGQVAELFNGFRQQLVTVRFFPHDQHDNDFELRDVTIDIFSVKNKRVRIGQGKDAEWENVDYVFFAMSVKMDVEGDFLKKMYSIFQETVRMEIA